MELHDAEEAIEMRKTLAHNMRMKKNPQTKEALSGFLRIFMELCESKVQLVPSHGNVINGVTNPEIVINDVTNPEIVINGVTNPEIVINGVTNPEIVINGVTNPEIVIIGVTNPEIVIIGVTNPEIVYMLLLFEILCID